MNESVSVKRRDSPLENLIDSIKIVYKNNKKENEYNNEKDSINSILSEIYKQIGERYDFVEALGIGGSGLIIKLKYKSIGAYRALKIPRPKSDVDELISSFKIEIKNLINIKIKNVIRIYEVGYVEYNKKQYPFFIMEYIENGVSFDRKVKQLIEEKDSFFVLDYMINKLYNISIALEILHKKYNIIHFDIKPDNILIDSKDNPILTDLGFARKKTNEAKEEMVVGFTLPYAHPDLTKNYRSMSSKNRVQNKLFSNQFKYSFDIYAFGKSILEILDIITDKFSDKVIYEYNFAYLHLAACRMLDGRNKDGKDSKENWMGLEADDFKNIKYTSFEEIRKDFEKLLKGNEYFKEKVPEIDPFYPKRIQTSSGLSAPFSKRVKYLVEHPVFSRLKYVPQLGFISMIYPTATHNRLEHSLGVFRNCILYVYYLWNDPYNPIFKQLMNEKDIKTVLVASLVHDIGHYPLAHEIEEFFPEFSHKKMAFYFLNKDYKDKNNRTLKEIITNEEWGWGIDIKDLFKILKLTKYSTESEDEYQRHFGLSSGVKYELLSSIIDGPIDVDKLDYLVRDSENCRLKYGDLIDVDRLLRNLTVIIYEEDYIKKACIGTYEKGQTAAESLAFARYLLYQSVYWHHTARATRAMLREAILDASKKEKFFESLEKLILNKNVKPITIEEILSLIESHSTSYGKEIINLIKERNYYKRILTVHYYPKSRSDTDDPLIDRFSNKCDTQAGREVLQEKLNKKIAKRVQTVWLSDKPKISLITTEEIDNGIKKIDGEKFIICDSPRNSLGSSETLRFIPEPQRLQRNYFARFEIGQRVSEVWADAYSSLMKIVSKGRVFCHPDVREIIMTALSPEELKTIVDKETKRNP